MNNYPETTPSRYPHESEKVLNCVCAHQPVQMTCRNRPNVILVLATDYEDLKLKAYKAEEA